MWALRLTHPAEQAVFWKRHRTMYDIILVRELLEKQQEYNLPIWHSFIDCEKAFDSVYTFTTIESLGDIGTDKYYTNITEII